ncbi:MAG: hypothetical protein QM608_06035 [Caulobacter sp.]
MAWNKHWMVAGAAVVALAVGGLAMGGMATARQERETPGVRLAQDVVAAASAFETYTRGAGAISPAAFTDGAGVAGALKAGAAYKAEQLEAGMIAYGAIAALQEPSFLEGVRRAARETSRDALVERLLASPESVVEIEGVGLAAARAQVALQGRGGPLAVAGRAVKQSAYDIQRQTWSKGPVADNAARLARVKQLSATVFTPGQDDAGRLIQAATGAGGGFAEGGRVFTPVTVRSAALAALAVLDAAGDADVARLAPVLGEKKTGYCMKMAKLNLYQCLAVAGPHYEDVFCLGQHAMIDTAQCVNDAAGGGIAAPAAAPPPPPRPLGFVIPVAAVSPAAMGEGSR